MQEFDAFGTVFSMLRESVQTVLSPLCARALHWLKHLWILPRFHGCPKIELRTVDHEVIRLMVLAVDNEMFV